MTVMIPKTTPMQVLRVSKHHRSWVGCAPTSDDIGEDVTWLGEDGRSLYGTLEAITDSQYEIIPKPNLKYSEMAQPALAMAKIILEPHADALRAVASSHSLARTCCRKARKKAEKGKWCVRVDIKHCWDEYGEAKRALEAAGFTVHREGDLGLVMVVSWADRK